jgi:predicted transcriptional regulator
MYTYGHKDEFMSASTTMTIRLSQDLKEKLDRIATDTRRSKSFLAGEAVSAYVDRELEIIEGIKRGLADAKAGRVIPHEQVMSEARQIISAAKEKRKKAGKR